MRAAFLIASLSLATLLVDGCARIPQNVEAVQGFQLDRYLGTWYEVARLDHDFERGLTNVTATYTKRSDGGVRVLNRGLNPETKEWKETVGKAYPVGDPSVGRLKVSFFGPFYNGYNIVVLDHDNYEYALVCGPTRSYLWILAREPELKDATLSTLLDTARRLKFVVEDLIYVTHDQDATS